MEKLCYVLWKPESIDAAVLRDRLLASVVPELRALGATRLSLLIADESCSALQQARITRMSDPVAGMLSLWLPNVDAHPAIEAVLAPHVARMAGYLVTESVVLAPERDASPPGVRTRGTTMLALLEKPARLSFEEWIRIWHGAHSPLAIEIQCTYLYVRNVVARALTPDAPPWRGLVEEGFPTDAVTDPMRWYEAEGDPAKLRENIGRMVASVRAFLDIDRIESHPLSEYVLG